ncbi:MAG TPA: DUF481 domain-containing protein [Tepidisphaeraceae bacterium]|nr:DUF481 domain-containing protein [Tepidisphaeraceae bacterium]
MFGQRMAAACAVGLGLCGTPAASADEVIFNNGDRLTGTILGIDGGKMKIKTKIAGEIEVKAADVKTFTTDGPVEFRTKDGARVTGPAKASEPGQVTVTPAAPAGQTVVAPPARPVRIADVKYLNFNEGWTGAIIGGAMFSRGNTYADQANIAFDATRRTEIDRWTFTGGYNFGRQRDPNSGDKFTSTDNWFATGKYDRFLSEKFYTFGSIRYEHDRIADLDYRLVPGVGLGYLWIDTPDTKFDTEAGLAYVCEKFGDDTSNSSMSLRLAYHFKKNLWADKVQLFHNLEYYPSLETLDDYLIVTDAGLRTAITEKMFAEYKIEFRYDASPSEASSRSDLRHIVGVGWKF